MHKRSRRRNAWQSAWRSLRKSLRRSSLSSSKSEQPAEEPRATRLASPLLHTLHKSLRARTGWLHSPPSRGRGFVYGRAKPPPRLQRWYPLRIAVAFRLLPFVSRSATRAIAPLRKMLRKGLARRTKQLRLPRGVPNSTWTSVPQRNTKWCSWRGIISAVVEKFH